MGTAEAFGDEALGELGRRGIPQATDVVTVNDGAEWIQGFVDLQCPQAHRVLDFAHATGYLAAAATEAFGEAAVAGTAWFAAQRRELRDGDPDAVLAALLALPAGEERDRSWRYLASRRSQIAYRDFVARGWPIGSGCVESAHKGVIQGRVKGRGMRWSRVVAEGMIALRVVQANARWTATWAEVNAHQRATHHVRTATRRTARRRPPPSAKLIHDGTHAARQRAFPLGPASPQAKRVQDGKPTADHPWRRFRLSGSPRAAET